jgi:hypothetical protein
MANFYNAQDMGGPGGTRPGTDGDAEARPDTLHTGLGGSRPLGSASSSHGYPEASYLPRPDVQVITAQTDSGYASLPHEKEARPRREPLDMEVSSSPADTDAMAEVDFSDVGTTYSDDRSQASVTRTQRYISEFVDHLFGKVKHHIVDRNVERLAECLPDLLQGFALKVGQSSATRGHFEVMYFVHKHRRYAVSLVAFFCSLTRTMHH